MPTKDELLKQAEDAGVEVDAKAKKAEIEAALAEAAPADAAPEEEVPAAVQVIERLDAPTDPLPGTPVETPEGIHEPIGEPQPDLEAPSSDPGVDPVVERGPLAATPAESVRHDNAGSQSEGGRA